MKASDLYEILEKMTSAERAASYVVLSCDAEGNGYSLLHEATRLRTGNGLDLSGALPAQRAAVASGPVIVLYPV